MNAYHVLAKETFDSSKDGNVGSFSDQKHFFVKAASPSAAIGLAESRVMAGPQPDHSTGKYSLQFTVKGADNRGSTSLAQGEEIYSL